MIEIIKKKYKKDSIIIIYTENDSFKGKIIDFSDNYIEIETSESTEFLSVKNIVRFSIPKEQNAVSNKSQENIGDVQTNNKDNAENKKDGDVSCDNQKKEYKVGEIIPLDKLEQDKSNKKKQKVKTRKTKFTKTLNDLSDLKELLIPEIEKQNKKIVSAIGSIYRYFGDRNFGFIYDQYNVSTWFGFKDIIDDELLNSLRGTVYNTNIPVLFSLSKNYKGDKAIFIQKPDSVENIIKKVKSFFEEHNKPDTAIGMLEQILYVYPDNIEANNLKEDYEKRRFKRYKSPLKYRTYDLNYQKAKKLHNVEKNPTEALKYYLLAFENNEKRESCIKDIAMLYVSLGENDKALDFMRQHEAELPKNITTYNYLENFYSSVKQFDKVIEYVDLLLEERLIEKDKRKYSMYLSKKGFALFQLGKIEDAKNVLEEATSIHSENTYAYRLLEAIENPDKEEVEQIIAEAEFDTFGGALSSLIKNTLDSYEQYYGVPPKIIETGDFTHATLKEIRRLIDKAGRARPRERANYLLTEAKLMTSLESEKENQLRSVLARYCNAMALNHISENSSMDVIRNYYLEAFSLEEKYDSTVRQVVLFLMTFKTTYGELLNIASQNPPPSIDTTLSYTLNEYNKYILENLLTMFLWNRSISAQLLSKFYSNESLKKHSLQFLQKIGIKISYSFSLEEYTNYWNLAREKRQREYSKWFASIKAIYNNDNIETLVNQLSESLIEAKKEWLPQLDVSRLNIIATDIYDILNQYLQKSGYRDKERSYNFAKAQINQLTTEISEKPTKFSYEAFIPLLEKIEFLLNKSFRIVEEASTPKVKLSILGDSSVVGKENIVPIQIAVENSKDSSPIRDMVISVIDNENIGFLEENNVYYDSIDGGEHQIFKLSIKISNKIIEDKAATLNIKCEYKTRNKEDATIIADQLSLRLYSEDEFEPIPNPYAPIADGGPVIDKKMFYGRDEFINNRIKAILEADSKQIIIYGQKRSGKSSVLYHLKKGLEETNKTFCISFSLGLIVQDLNEFTFYHKILSSIERELKLRKANNKIIPEFTCLSLDEFKNKYASNPANGFVELMEDFKIACSELDDWTDKKLVIMIDEFTYLYTAIKQGATSPTIMKQWKAITQNENAKFSVVLVGQDVVPSFKNEDYAKNAFGVIEDIRLTYLDKEDVKRLIEEPIYDKNGNTRYLGNAVETIIDYTSRNPYYIQSFCARLVDYMNANKFERITEADVKEVAESFLEGAQALAPEKFDNLIRAGEEHDFKEFDDEPIIRILRQIATASKNIGVCARDNISLDERVLEDKILKHLVGREVLELKQGNNYKIQVKLFQEWLLKH